MERIDIIERIGKKYLISNTEKGEFSYAHDNKKAKLKKELGEEFNNFYVDMRFCKDDVVILVETKAKFTQKDEKQLKAYLEAEKALRHSQKIIAILANTDDNKIKVWKNHINDECLLKNEVVLDTMEHYMSLFEINKQNDREKVLKNTYDLNELLHKKDIDEKLRSQFVGTTLLYIKNEVKKRGVNHINDKLVKDLKEFWSNTNEDAIRVSIERTLSDLLDGSNNKAKKIELLQKNVLNDQKIKKLKLKDWIEILTTILTDIYKYIDTESEEGQDILNLFFIAFNKYTGKADKNQAFTPDHITDFMCRVVGVDRTKRVLDITCGSGSFLVQAMVKELSDCKRGKTEKEAKELMEKVKKDNIYGIEVEEKAYGLATTNMLIHGDGNSNIEFGSCFEKKEFIKAANPDIILMNPPYNAKPISIPEYYKNKWSKGAKEGKEDPTKGLVFIQYLSDIIKEINEEREAKNEARKEVKLAVLLPMSAAIGSKSDIKNIKEAMLENNTLEAVFTLPAEVFYPGASVSACCMIFTLGKPHINSDGTTNETFFGYFKENGFKKKKNLGRVELFDEGGESKWKKIEEQWLDVFRNKKVVDGLSAMAKVSGEDEWLCEAYMKTDYSKLSRADFQNYLSFLMQRGQAVEVWQFIEKYINGIKGNIFSINTLSLNINKWGEFLLSDIFKCSTTMLSIKDELLEGNTPFISRTALNNGCDGYVEVEAKFITKGNCISIGAEGIYAFYQKENFATGNKIYTLRNEKLNQYVALFICAVLNHEVYRYSYGRARILSKLQNEYIKLPINHKGELDFEFMENYIKSLPYGDRV
ncbi:N-6 DNA methylase [Campylobacter upsaliensis]|uniref:N-6 DNA methylase n=1 Tax=Campylobacter upsaliensis TaxID=28080 RepID=UPI0022EA6E93|nr:N-6 DNA methylase [Campylobacter upsaliensis]MEB2807157.1 N-6 DNA methylase [Campylobacter upsaliensis]MEB2818815.1 N-6 DNA methylase [Campylobacter upsaliensis]